MKEVLEYTKHEPLSPLELLARDEALVPSIVGFPAVVKPWRKGGVKNWQKRGLQIGLGIVFGLTAWHAFGKEPVYAAPITDDQRVREVYSDPHRITGDGDGDEPPLNPLASLGMVTSSNFEDGESSLTMAQNMFAGLMEKTTNASPKIGDVPNPKDLVMNSGGVDTSLPLVLTPEVSNPERINFLEAMTNGPDYSSDVEYYVAQNEIVGLKQVALHTGKYAEWFEEETANGGVFTVEEEAAYLDQLKNDLNVSMVNSQTPDGLLSSFPTFDDPKNGDRVALWAIDNVSGLMSQRPDVPGSADSHFAELRFPKGFGVSAVDHVVFAFDSSSENPVVWVDPTLGQDDGAGQVISSLKLINPDGTASNLKVERQGADLVVLDGDGEVVTRSNASSNGWLGLDISVSAGNETGISAEMGAMGISFDGEFYHGAMPDGGEFSAVMVENESGVGLVDKGNHFLAAAQDENGQWEWVGLNIGRMVTTAEAESAQTISLEQVWDGSYARWCDLMFGVENRKTSTDLSPKYESYDTIDLLRLVKYARDGDVFQVKDVKRVMIEGSELFMFHVRAGLGNGWVESINLIGPMDDRDSLKKVMGIRDADFSLDIASDLKPYTDGNLLFSTIGPILMDKQIGETAVDLSSLFRNLQTMPHGSLRNVVVPITEVWSGN